MLSRNFRLQKVGDLSWLKENYELNSLLYSIDELVVLNVNRGHHDLSFFNATLADLVKDCLMPVAAGGGIKSDSDVQDTLNSGVDKIVLNTLFFKDLVMVKRIIARYGSQCVVASIDYKVVDGKKLVFVDNGTMNTGMDITEAAQRAIDAGAGEIYLTSIDKDGTGQGYDISGISEITSFSTVPVIASGGVGKFDQLYDGIILGKADAVSTANLFYFMGDALTEARIALQSAGLSMAVW